MREKVGGSFILAARVAYLALILFAAANFGLTRPSGILIFNYSMGATVLLWLFGSAMAGRKPRVGWLPFLIVFAILIMGWFTTVAGLLESADTDTSEWPDWLEDLLIACGTYDPALSLASMFRCTVLLGAFLMAVDLFAAPPWGKRLVLSVCLAGVGVVGFVFLQKLTGNLLMLKSLDGRIPLSFGPYRYWGNAASFLNLIWPVLAAIALHTGMRHARGWSAWMAAAILVFSALYINISKAGQALGIVGLALFGSFALLYILRRKRLSLATFPWQTAAVITVLTLLLAVILFFGVQWSRWDRLQSQGLQQNERLVAYRYFIKILPDAGWTGCGPGTFQRVYMHYVGNDPVMHRTPFWVAHQDYLQTLVEWGYIGTILWGALLVPGALMLAGRCFRPSRNGMTTEPGYAFDLMDKLHSFFRAVPDSSTPLIQGGVLIAIILTALHAGVDFPMQIESLQFYFLIWIALGWQAGKEPVKED